jgi:hypothetical protein
MIRVGSIINAFGTYADVFIYTGSYVRDVYVKNPVTEKIQIFGSLQEVAGKNLKFLPEGARLEGLRIFFSQQELPIDDFQYGEGQNDIRFVINEITYRLIENKHWEGDYSVFVIQLLRSDNAVPV